MFIIVCSAIRSRLNLHEKNKFTRIILGKKKNSAIFPYTKHDIHGLNACEISVLFIDFNNNEWPWPIWHLNEYSNGGFASKMEKIQNTPISYDQTMKIALERAEQITYFIQKSIVNNRAYRTNTCHWRMNWIRLFFFSLFFTCMVYGAVRIGANLYGTNDIYLVLLELHWSACYFRCCENV